jgi:pyruvate carboxylase subunit B
LKPAGGEKFGGEIRALMPGRVTSVLVGEGEVVELGDPLLIFEAMKMLNEISSPFAGRVVRVHVREGETVRKDAILMVLE